MPVTVNDVVTDAQELVGEVAGIGVQTYGEDIMIKHAIRGFNMLHTKYPWDEYRKWFQLALDGTTGRFTANNSFDNVRDFGDFLIIKPTGQTQEIPVLHHRENPFAFAGSGYPRRYTSVVATDANWQAKRLQFYPVAATGTLDVCCRMYPVAVTAQIIGTTSLHLDRDLLVYATAFQALAMDDTNSNAMDTVRSMLDNRFNDLTVNRASKPMQVSGGNGIPTDWTEAP